MCKVAKPEVESSANENRSCDRKSCDRKSCDPDEKEAEKSKAAPSSREKRRERRKHRTSSANNVQDSSGEIPDLERGEGQRSQTKMAANFNGSGSVGSASGSGLTDHMVSSGSANQNAALKSESTNPGPVLMDCLENEKNILIDERIWLKWTDWYGVSESHQLDRRSWSSQEKEFEICILSPYSCIVENPTKILDLSECMGYVEVQLRKIYRVPLHKKTRIWICEKARQARFRTVLDRSHVLECATPSGGKLNLERDYILALEVATPSGCWPTAVPGDPQGELSDLLTLTRGRVTPEYWIGELSQTVDSVFTEISSEMRETAEGIVQVYTLFSQLFFPIFKLLLSLKETLRRYIGPIKILD